MNRLFYCPQCKEEGVNLFTEKEWRNMRTVSHPRDGWGRPVTFYKCPKCGNVLAGSMDINGWEEKCWEYVKSVIKGYNESGTYYHEKLHEYCSKVMNEQIKR